MATAQQNEVGTTYRARWYNRAGVWIGIGINPASITLGGGLASRLELNYLIWLVPIGVTALTSLSIAAGIIGKRRREPFSIWSASTFGAGLGAILINAVMALGMTGWSGFQMGLGGTSLGNLIFFPGWIGVILMAVMVVTLGRLGVNRWNWFVWLTTISALSLAIFALVLVGLREPIPVETEPFSLGQAFWVIGSIIAFASLFSLRSTDFTWDLATDRDVIIDGLCFAGTFTTSLIIGILLYRATGQWDLALILDGTSIAFLGQLFLFVSLLSPALSSMHSGALAYKHFLPITYFQGLVLITSVGMTLGLLRFDQQLLQFLDWIGAIVPPAVAVLIVTASKRINLSPKVYLAAWLVGAAVALVFKVNGQLVHLAAGTATSLLILLFATFIGFRTTGTIKTKRTG